MRRTFNAADYDATLDVTVRLGDCLSPNHLARFVVDIITQLDLSAHYIHAIEHAVHKSYKKSRVW
jgi:hypothetical protein